MKIIEEAKEFLNTEIADEMDSFEAHDFFLGRNVRAEGIICELVKQLELYKGLLVAEQEDCQLQRMNKNANWERAELLAHVMKIADEYLDTNKMTNIMHGSVLHQQFKEALGRVI